jgi:hypothetical protein
MLSALLIQKSFLQSIELRGNRLGDSGALLLSTALRRNFAVRNLSLADNDIRESGAMGLCAVLVRPSPLSPPADMQMCT